KLTEVQARRFIVFADHTKLVEHIGEKTALAIEIARFGFLCTIARLRVILPSGRLRLPGALPYVSLNGNYIFDAQIPAG
ncbi:ribose-5-phosphate isomerase A, partial [Deinococcus sp. GbtcB9]|uniref:ribose-5-phosphate isomerase A n=1 Tax=Deinococcus sp. GbtcB9 TaxID=2824754 RepID=UPI001C307C6E